jgi:hypothetical protein
MDEADRDEQFEEIQNPEWGCLPTLETLLSLLSTFFEEKPMIRKEICGSGVKLVFYINNDSLMAQVTFDHVDDESGRETAFFSANDFIELGQTLSSVEQGEAHDAAVSLDMGKLAENMNDSMNKLAIMGNLKGGKNEA